VPITSKPASDPLARAPKKGGGVVWLLLLVLVVGGGGLAAWRYRALIRSHVTG
jgi:hypothetical protein